MARKTTFKTTRKTASKTTRQRLKLARKGEAARVKNPRQQARADSEAAHGELPQWTNAEVEEAFRRFAAANPTPRGELQSINPFTLLVAVVLSAQATDAGVNKATPALFKLADTPEKMVKLGETRVRSLIKTIGLYRTKAKNVIALSRQLIAEHGGKVPHDREALEALPGVGRKTANVVLNTAFGEPTIAVDTHIFRVGNRTGLAVGKTPLDVEMKLMQVVPERYRLHAHHWLILHGRYTCLARRPLCEKCLIADLCKWPGKTTNMTAKKSSSTSSFVEREIVMTDKSAEESKKENVEKMGEALGTVYSALWQSVATAFLYWKDYTELFGTSAERVAILNKAAPTFFRMIQDELWETSLLHLTRLTDAVQSQGDGDKSNLTVGALPSLISDEGVKTEVAKLVDEARQATEFARDWRNRHIAHRDLKLALEQPTKPLAEASRVKVRAALDAIADVLNCVAGHYLKSETQFDFAARRDGAVTLLYLINDGLRSKEAKLARLERGEPLETDFDEKL